MALPAPIQSFVDGPRLPKVVLGVVGLVALGAAAYFLLIAPAQERIAALRQKKAQVTTEVDKARIQVAEIERFRREIVELEKRLALLADRLASEKETPAPYPAPCCPPRPSRSAWGCHCSSRRRRARRTS